MKERELEDRLIERLRDFILELGYGLLCGPPAAPADAGKERVFSAGLNQKVRKIIDTTMRDGNRRILKLSLAVKRREWFLELWDKTSRFALPVTLET